MLNSALKFPFSTPLNKHPFKKNKLINTNKEKCTMTKGVSVALK